MSSTARQFRPAWSGWDIAGAIDNRPPVLIIGARNGDVDFQHRRFRIRLLLALLFRHQSSKFLRGDRNVVAVFVEVSDLLHRLRVVLNRQTALLHHAREKRDGVFVVDG
jgi:hypothetical protein